MTAKATTAPDISPATTAEQDGNTMKDREILTLDPGGTVRTLALVDEHERAHQLIIRGDPPVRFVHDGRAWCATGDMIQPPACPLSYEYRLAEDIT